ncbi:MAG: acetoacetate decarboxylase family protein [Promethearchaeota archaeon]
MIGGREIFGYPKKMAKIVMERDEKAVHAYSERLGTKNIEVHAMFDGKFNEQETPKIISDMKLLPSKKRPTINYNIKAFPSADKTGFDYKPRLVKQLTTVKPKNFEMGSVEIKLTSSDHDPWGEVEVVRSLWSLFIYSDNTMQPGHVVAEVEPDDFLPYSFHRWDWY